MNRVEEMRQLLEEGRYFKLVCGAGNEDCEEVRRLALIYTLAGANAFDVSATPEVVTACISGIQKAYELASQFNTTIENRPFVNVSVGLPGDHHVRKAVIDLERCISCNRCIEICPKDAISNELIVDPTNCIGCGHCASICPSKNTPITFKHNAKTIDDILPKCFSAGAETVELHAAVTDDGTIMEEWKQVKSLCPNHFISMCLDRAQLSNTQVVQRVKEASQIAGDLAIIQADGVPMSGGSDNFRTTVQAIAIAELLQKEFYENPKRKENFYMLLSGGTNGYTAELAQICDIKYHGLSIGSHARKIVKKYTKNANYRDDYNYLKTPYEIARDLITKREQIKAKYD